MANIYRAELDRLYKICHSHPEKIAFLCLSNNFATALKKDIDYLDTSIEHKKEFLGVPIIIDETIDGCFQLILKEKP